MNCVDDVPQCGGGTRISAGCLRNVGVGRRSAKGIGLEGQGYAWTDIYAFEFQGDAVAWICQYNVEDETQAFADAEARTLLSPRRLAVANRARRGSCRWDRRVAAGRPTRLRVFRKASFSKTEGG